MLIECAVKPSCIGQLSEIIYSRIVDSALNSELTPSCHLNCSPDMPPRRAPSHSSLAPSRPPSPPGEEMEVCSFDTMKFIV